MRRKGRETARFRSWIALVLGFVLFTENGVYAGGGYLCGWNLQSERELAAIPIENFAARKQKWREKPRGTVKDPYDVLAMMEIAAERDGFDVLRISKVMDSGDREMIDDLLGIAGRLKSKKRWTRVRVRRTVARLYALVNPPLENFRLPGILRRRLPVSAEELILKRYDLEIGTKAIEDAFKEMGFIRNPRLFGWFRLWKSNHPVLFDTVSAATWNAFWIGFFGIPGGLPKSQLSKLLSITEELRHDYKIANPRQLKDLPPEVYAAIMKRHGLVGRLDVGISYATAVYSAVSLGILIYFLFDPETRVKFKKLEMLVSLAFVTDADLKDFQEKNFDCEATRQRLWDSFREGFKDLNDRYPDPATHPEDAQSWNANHRQIMDVDCESLKVKFD